MPSPYPSPTLTSTARLRPPARPPRDLARLRPPPLLAQDNEYGHLRLHDFSDAVARLPPEEIHGMAGGERPAVLRCGVLRCAALCCAALRGAVRAD